MQLVGNCNLLHVRQLRNGANREAAVHQPVVDEHVRDAKQRDAKPSAKTTPTKDARREEAIRAQAHGRHAVHDGKQVVGLEWPGARHVVAFVQRPAGLVIVPQRLVRPASPHFHAKGAASD
eukprot:365180-Chlamydomonas_euryale.AAC.8